MSTEHGAFSSSGSRSSQELKLKYAPCSVLTLGLPYGFFFVPGFAGSSFPGARVSPAVGS